MTNPLLGTLLVALLWVAPAVAQGGGQIQLADGKHLGVYYYDGNPILHLENSGLSFADGGSDAYALLYGRNGLVIKINNGDIEAFHNGEKVSEDRIDRSGNRIRIRDEDGDVIAELEEVQGKVVLPKDGTLSIPGPTFWRQGQRVIIGVHLGAVSEALATQLDVLPDEVCLITGIMEGYPAEKAGLQAYDVITRINGESPATAQRLREVLADKKEGDEITLEVLRQGRERRVTVEAVKAKADAWGYRLQPGARLQARSLFQNPSLNSAQRNLGRALSFYNLTNPKSAKKKESEKSIEERLKRVERLLEELLEKQRKL